MRVVHIKTVVAAVVAAGLISGPLAGPAAVHASGSGNWQRPIPAEARRFLLPSSLTGPLAGNPHMGTGCQIPCPAYADYYRGRAASALWAGAQGLYLYQVRPRLPAKSWVGAIYLVAVYGTAEAARQANLSQRDGTQSGLLLDPQSHAVPLAHPVNATTEWLRGYLSLPSTQFVGHPRDCYAMGGIRYQNVLMLAQVDDWGSITPRGQAPCQASATWTTRMLAALYARAARQKAVPVPAAQPAPTATPAPDPAQEFGMVAGAEQFATTQLSNFATLSQLKDEGLLSAQTFGTTAQQLQHTPDQIIDNLRAMPMSGRYATARTLLLDALRNVTYLWESVMASGGQSYDVGYYRIALAELQTAEQYVSPS